MSIRAWYLETSKLLKLVGVVDKLSGDYVNNATAQVVEIVDSNSVIVSGETFPISFSYVAGSNGNYTATVDEDLALTEGASYEMKLRVNAGGLQRTMKVPLIAKWDEGD